MKATGIVRRIDDLGRIVIPKEIRRTLRLRESDPVEIFTSSDGEIILKKYSPIGEMASFAKQYVESLAQVSGRIALIADRDQIIAIAGGCKYLLGKAISKELEKKMENRELILAKSGEKNYISISDDLKQEDVSQLVACPILCEGDMIGSVILIDGDHPEGVGHVEQKLVMAAAGFLGRQMEQ